ncbi:ciliogenesis-associated TTC17-interacting protein [Brachionichthys hirsutus]|uniref:ciliogenesis-associated TTC17-interacting protein n=1 Tax=Brachionichthys hirsutus TaxID=412623 RepID=UPI003604327A
MAAPQDDLAGGGGLRASAEAMAFMSGIEPAELQRCVFSDSLVTVSEGGRDLGGFSVSVEFTHRGQQPCVKLHAQSQGAVGDSPCGTTVTAYVTTDLEVLQEDSHEHVKLESHRLDRRCHMVQRDGQMVIHQVTAAGEDVTEERRCYPMSALRGALLTEGSNLLLLRLVALRRSVPEHVTFLSLDRGLHLVHATLRGLGLKQLQVGGETVEVFGVERRVHTVESPPTWQCYFLVDGRLASRRQVGSPVVWRLLQLTTQPQKEKITLAREEDMEMRSEFLDRKAALTGDHASYLRQRAEVRALLSDFLQFLLLRKPDDVYRFAREYFLSFAPSCRPQPGLNAPPL